MPRIVSRILVALALVAMVGASAFYGMRYVAARKGAEAPQPKTAKIDRGAVVARVTATGTLSARVTVQVGSQVSGRIQEIFVDFNSPVKKGQVLAKIDPRVFEATVRKARAAHGQAKANVIKAKANAEQAERAFARAKSLQEQGLLGQADFEIAQTAVGTARADIAVAESALESASATLNEAQVNLGFTTISSPIDGTVISRAIDVGQTVAASLQSPVLFTLAEDLRRIQVDTFVAEGDVGKIAAGMDATFTVDAFPGRRFQGSVREVRNAAQTVQNVVTYDAVIDVANEGLELRPGMTANVTFVWAKKEGVLRVPNAALRFRMPDAARSARPGRSADGPPRPSPSAESREPDARKTIWVMRAGAPTAIRIEPGVTDGTMTEIVSGDVAEGDEVVTEMSAPAGAPSARSPLGPTGGGGGRRGGL
jgi:HlyD family secretion protein